jgi:dTDP-D-glucose 4,6-dehydratase
MLATLYPPARAQPPEGVRRHLHVSAIEVHGELPPTTASFDEARPPQRQDAYRASKPAGEQIMRVTCRPDLSVDVMTY